MQSLCVCECASLALVDAERSPCFVERVISTHSLGNYSYGATHCVRLTSLQYKSSSPSTANEEEKQNEYMSAHIVYSSHVRMQDGECVGSDANHVNTINSNSLVSATCDGNKQTSTSTMDKQQLGTVPVAPSVGFFRQHLCRHFDA